MLCIPGTHKPKLRCQKDDEDDAGVGDVDYEDLDDDAYIGQIQNSILQHFAILFVISCV